MPGWLEGIREVLIEEEEIRRRVSGLGAEISRDYAGRSPLLIAVLRGAAIFVSDLMREISVNVSLDFISVSSYGGGTGSSGQVQLIKDLEGSVEGMDVILVEDIVDTGLTLNYLVRLFQSRRPSSLCVCALLSKPSRRVVPASIDYLGFEIPDRFVVGYGLDLNERYRNLSYLAVCGEGVGGQE